MDVRELVERGTDRVVAVYCGNCGGTYRLFDERLGRRLAEECCDRDIIARRREEASQTLARASSRLEREAAEREAQALARAKRLSVEEYGCNPVYLDGYGKDGYFASVDEFVDYVLGSWTPEQPIPEYVWACTIHVPSIDAEQVLDHALQSLIDDGLASEDTEWTDVCSFQRACEAFNLLQTHESWLQDETRIVEVGELLRSELRARGQCISEDA